MAGRIRSIKPEVLDDELAAGLSDAAWRLWVSSWVLADDYGNVRAGSKYLAANVWQDTSRDVEAAVQELIDKGRWERYAVKGQRYVHIHAWDKHQRVDNAGKARVPTQVEDDGTWDQGVTPILAENLRSSPKVAESSAKAPVGLQNGVASPAVEEVRELGADLAETRGGSPLARRARAQSGGETPTSDLRSPTTDHRPAPGGASVDDGPVSPAARGMRHLPKSEARLWGPARMSLYESAVASVLGRTWSFDKRQLDVLTDAIGAHCTDKTRIDPWITERVTAFVKAVRKDEAKFWSAYQPKGFARWLNEHGPDARGTNGTPPKKPAPKVLTNGEGVLPLSSPEARAGITKVLKALKTVGTPKPAKSSKVSS